MLPPKTKARGTSKTVYQGETNKSGMADNIWKEKRNSVFDEVKIIDREELWRIKPLKKAVHMVAYCGLLSRTSIEMNTI